MLRSISLLVWLHGVSVVSLSFVMLPAQHGSATVDFNRDIRPLLSDRCFKCHGFDEAARKAKLRLDTRLGQTTPIEGRQPVVPGDTARSELLRRIESSDRKVMMPPPSSGVSLSAEEKALLRRWIDEGAVYAKHWAYVPPTKSLVPATDDGAPNPIDAFVGAAARAQTLAPSPQTDRASLLRRASLDLTGLPPTPEVLAAFVSDPDPAAYEHAVDRLLASPHFGERMALMWLDAARYADTNGFHHDNVRTSWPYRDWVIGAFNDNLPYDRFVTEQLAGDLMPSPTTEQRIATGFCRMHNINDEGGALDPEYRVEAVCDRIETIATTFMGLTFTCARCHDHKYDPFTQADYYSLYALFGSVEERGVYGADFEQARAYPPRLAFRDAELVRKTEAAERMLVHAKAKQVAAEPAIALHCDAAEALVRQRHGNVRWVDAKLVAAQTAAGEALELLDDGSARAKDNPERDTHVLELSTDAENLRLLRLEVLTDKGCGHGSVGLASHGNVVISGIRAEAISRVDPARVEPIAWSWAWADHEQPNNDHDVHNVLAFGDGGWALDGHRRIEPRTALLLAERPFGFTGGTTLRVSIEYRSRYANHVAGRVRVSLAQQDADHQREPGMLAEFPIVSSDWFMAGPFKAKTFDAAFDQAFGPEHRTQLDIEQAFGDVRWQHRPGFVDGKEHALKGERAAFYLARTLRTPEARTLRCSFGSDDALRVFVNGQEVLRRKVLRGVSEGRDTFDVMLRAGENVLVLKVVNDGGPAGFFFEAQHSGSQQSGPQPMAPLAFIPASRRDDALNRRARASFGQFMSPTYARLAAATDEARRARDALDAEATPVLVMQELPQPKPTYVLARGRYDMVDESRPVSRRPPMELGGELPAGAPENRLGFAQWLTRKDHPLTARVHVNRLWQMLFGTGIVKSAENFGFQADWPSHRELLDWLAVWFMESGWDQKALLRLVMTSATYRQASAASATGKAVDPENRLLSWFPRQRLAGELVRDQALFVSGLLVDRIGGPSVKPYQPEHLWKEVSIGDSSNTGNFARDEGAALYRRSLYTFWKRTSPNPQMSTFDAPTREFCVVRRSVTNTPLQALVLWNDVQFLEAARALAQRTVAEVTGDAARLASMFERCTGRAPGAREQAILQRTLDGFRARYQNAASDAEALLAQGESKRPVGGDAVELAAFMMLASTVLNLDETLVRD